MELNSQNWKRVDDFCSHVQKSSIDTTLVTNIDYEMHGKKFLIHDSVRTIHKIRSLNRNVTSLFDKKSNRNAVDKSWSEGRSKKHLHSRLKTAPQLICVWAHFVYFCNYFSWITRRVVENHQETNDYEKNVHLCKFEGLMSLSCEKAINVSAFLSSVIKDL